MALNYVTADIASPPRVLEAAPDLQVATEPSPSLPSRLGATVVGGAAVLVGAWGGVVPYIGHAIHYSADGSATWTWNLQHGLLSLLPGAVAMVAGLLVIASAWIRSERPVLNTTGLSVAAVLLGLSAAWFLVGPSVWPIYYTGHLQVAASPLRTFANQVGYHQAEAFILAGLAGVTGLWALHSLPSRARRSVR